MSDEGLDRPIPLAGSSDVGSERLAAALAAMDIDAIGRALRHDYVVVPLLRGEDGGTQIRVVSSSDPDGEKAWDLCLFSSSETFGAFVADDPDREFALRRGVSLAPFIERFAHLLRRVVFDPAGPHPVQASVDDVLASLAPHADDDDVSWVTGPGRPDGPERGLREGERVVGLELALTDDWATIDLSDPDRLADDVAQLVTRQLSGIPNAPVLRGQLTSWLTSTARTASRAGGVTMAYLVRRTKDAAAALSVTLYWHDLGPAGATSHLDGVVERLGPSDETQEIARAETASGPFVRHTHRRMGPADLGGRPVVVIDYWLEAPDRAGLAHVSFSTPHVDALGAIRVLSDNVVLRAAWQLAPGDGTPTH